MDDESRDSTILYTQMKGVKTRYHLMIIRAVKKCIKKRGYLFLVQMSDNGDVEDKNKRPKICFTEHKIVPFSDMDNYKFICCCCDEEMQRPRGRDLHDNNVIVYRPRRMKEWCDVCFTTTGLAVLQCSSNMCDGEVCKECVEKILEKHHKLQVHIDVRKFLVC